MYHFEIFKPENILISISEIVIKIQNGYFDICKHHGQYYNN